VAVRDVDVVVVGGGNAGMVAALAAREAGAEVMLLERGLPDQPGGNSFFTAGATRIVHDGLQDLLAIVEPDDRHGMTVVPPYTAAEFEADMRKVTEGNNDPDLTRTVIAESRSGMQWLHDNHGVKYRLMYERQAYQRADGSYLFWGGLHVGNVDGGEGLVRDETSAVIAAGIRILYGHHVQRLLFEGDRVVGVAGDADGSPFEIGARSIVIAAGGFEADPTLRREHLGAGWENAKVRGTPYNTGELLTAAIEAGAGRGGDWSTCHSVAWDAEYPQNEGNRELTNRLTRQSYPLGVVVNCDGQRFIDEGADFRNYTYAKYGREILRQPGSIAYQLFDGKTRPMLRPEEYDMPGVSVYEAESLEALAGRAGIDPRGLAEEVAAFNASIDLGIAFDPNVKDGRRADVTPPKSNWALPLDTAPYYAYPVTCGITFTFGGLKSDVDGRVLRESREPISGLFVAGEALGGLFSKNYPGGTGLAAGIVFGRRAGISAAAFSLAPQP